MDLNQAKAYLMAHAMDGVSCPCCGQHYKVYTRKINANMAYSLIKLYVHMVAMQKEWVHAPTAGIDKQRELAKLKHWGLIEDKANEDTAKSHSGWWRITSAGMDFVTRRTSMPTSVHLLANVPLGFSDGNYPSLKKHYSTIDDALGRKFNYAELMGMEIT